MRPFISGTIAALALVASVSLPALADDTVATPPAAEPVDVGTTTVPAVSDATAKAAEKADEDAADLVAQLPARRTDDFGLVGVTWDRGFDPRGMTVQVRLRTDDAWSDWEELHVESQEGEGGRDGTEPLWAGSADGVAVRVTSPTGERPKGLSVATIDPGTNPKASSATATATPAFFSGLADTTALQASDGSPIFTAKPTIISRGAWGARRNTYCDNPHTGNETRGVVVHHTAGTNSYSKSKSASIVRAVQAYHMKSRHWCDIGYNFLVDKYGQIFEGRVGGVDRPVRAAHAGDRAVNTYTMGVSMMGTFSSSEPSAATKTAMVKLIGWRIGTTYHPATGTYKVGKYTLNRIAGHRNVVSTSCPGAKAYAWLSRPGGLRARVAAYISGYRSPMKTLVQSMGPAATGPVYIGETRIAGGRKSWLKNMEVYDHSVYGTHPVIGSFRTAYNALRAEQGALGFPSSDKATTPVSNVMVQRFAKGALYRVVRNDKYTVYGIWGPVQAKYVELGEAGGALGASTTGMVHRKDGADRAYFEHGLINITAAGVVSVVYT